MFFSFTFAWWNSHVLMTSPWNSHDVPTMFTWCSHDVFANKLTWHSHVIPLSCPNAVLLFAFHSIFISCRIIIFWTRDVATCNGMRLQLPIMPGALQSCHMGLTQGSSLPSIMGVCLQVLLWNACILLWPGRTLSSKIVYYVLLHLKEVLLLFP
jgi:hypothetical protein